MIHLIFSLILNFSATASAVETLAKAVYCPDKSEAQLMAFYEGEVLGQPIETLPGVTLEERLQFFIDQLSPYEMSMSNGPAYITIYHFLEEVRDGLIDIQFVPNSLFELVDDSFGVLPIDCERRQIAVRKGNIYLVNQILWDLISDDEKAVLLMQMVLKANLYGPRGEKKAFQRLRDILREVTKNTFSLEHFLDRFFFYVDKSRLHTFKLRGITHRFINAYGYHFFSGFLQTNMGSIMLHDRRPDSPRTTPYSSRIKGNGIQKIRDRNFEGKTLVIQNKPVEIAGNSIYLYESGEVCGITLNTTVSLFDQNGDPKVLAPNSLYAFSKDGKVMTNEGLPYIDEYATQFCIDNY